MRFSNSFMSSLFCPSPPCPIRSNASMLATSISATSVQYRSAQKSVITRPFPQRCLKGGARVRDVDVGDAAWHLRRVVGTNPAAALVGVRKQVVLAAAGDGEARLEPPAQNLGAPRLRRRRIRAGELGVGDPTVQAARRHVTRRRRARGSPRGPPLGRSFRWSSWFLRHGDSGLAHRRNSSSPGRARQVPSVVRSLPPLRGVPAGNVPARPAQGRTPPWGRLLR